MLRHFANVCAIFASRLKERSYAVLSQRQLSISIRSVPAILEVLGFRTTWPITLYSVQYERLSPLHTALVAVELAVPLTTEHRLVDKGV